MVGSNAFEDALKVTADSVSAGIIVGAIASWTANVVDLGLLRPLQLNMWRQLAGIENLPLPLGRIFALELGSFHRWWYVVCVTLVLTLLAALSINAECNQTWRLYVRPVVFAAILYVATYKLYYIPTDLEGLADWSSRLMPGIAMVLAIGVGIFAIVRKSMQFVILRGES